MSNIYCFGDSWGYGAELNNPQVDEHPFVHWFAKTLNLPYENYSQEGASLGIILHRIALTLSKINQNDIVLIIVPPDVRWYDESKEKGFYTLMQWQTEDYMKSLNNKTIEWFKYHHLLFIYAIQKSLNDIGCYYIMAHNYGQLPLSDNYKFSIDYNKFLNSVDLTTLLSSNPCHWDSYQLESDGPIASKGFHGEYFQGTVCHPNELGHKRIAEMFLQKYRNE